MRREERVTVQGPQRNNNQTECHTGGQGGFLVKSLVDGAGSHSVAHRAGLLPTELTGMWGWILLRSRHQSRGHPQPPPPLSKGLAACLDARRTERACAHGGRTLQCRVDPLCGCGMPWGSAVFHRDHTLAFHATDCVLENTTMSWDLSCRHQHDGIINEDWLCFYPSKVVLHRNEFRGLHPLPLCPWPAHLVPGGAPSAPWVCSAMTLGSPPAPPAAPQEHLRTGEFPSLGVGPDALGVL